MRKLVLLMGAMAVLGLAACGGDDDDGDNQGTGGACAELIECNAACGTDDQDCHDACEENASPEAVTEMFGVAFCMGMSGCADDDTACLQEACGEEFAGCF